MIEKIRNFLNYFNQNLKEDLKLPKLSFDKIVICGIGGSAIAGDILIDAFQENLKFPIIVSRSFNLPNYCNEKTLVICISYSGNTKETLTQFKKAFAKKCKIILISSNGKLETISKKRKIPFVKVSKNFQPREAIALLISSAIKILNSLKLIKIKRVKIENPENFAKKIAENILNKNLIIYSIYYSVAKRLKNQLNENSKLNCRFEVVPEAFHNDIESFYDLDENYCLVLLRDLKSENEEIKKGYEFLKKIFKGQIIEIFANGKSKLERILYLIWFSDYLSYYLSILRNKDPEKIENIKNFKKFAY